MPFVTLQERGGVSRTPMAMGSRPSAVPLRDSDNWTLLAVRGITSDWLERYNEIRPHDPLGSVPSAR